MLQEKLMKQIAKVRQALTRIQPILLWLISLYFTISFVRNGIRKFDPEGFWAPAFERWGYPVWFMFFIGFLETAGGIAILIPKVRHFGGMVLALVMLGAFTTRAIHGVGFSDASYIFYAMVVMLYLSSDLSGKTIPPSKGTIEEE